MGIKRKHTDDASSTSNSSFGTVSTPDAQSPVSFSRFDGVMEMDNASLPQSNGWNFARAHRVKSGDWGNRTRKRVRDNRPDERSIHGTCSRTSFISWLLRPSLL